MPLYVSTSSLLFGSTEIDLTMAVQILELSIFLRIVGVGELLLISSGIVWVHCVPTNVGSD